MKLSPTQLRVLRYASEGRLQKWSKQHAWEATIRGTFQSERVDAQIVGHLKRMRLLIERSARSGSIVAVVTPKGQALLNELDQKGAPCRTT